MQANGLQVNDGSNTHSNGDVFMWAFDVDNAVHILDVMDRLIYPLTCEWHRWI